MEPTASLVIATYNWNEALSAVLRSVRGQTVQPEEVIIADDGSRDDTRALVEAEARTFPTPLIHAWHEDRGFRLGTVRNLAMARARGDYILQLDGDMLLHRAFVESHKRFALRGTYVQGSRVLLGAEQTRRCLAAGALVAHPLSRGVRNRINGIYAPVLSRFAQGPGDLLRRTRGCNMAFWRDDILRVNGYNEDIEGWGREDSELVARLQNAGIRRRNLKFAGVAWHLDHPTHALDSLERNHALFERVRAEHVVRCEHGIDRHLIK